MSDHNVYLEHNHWSKRKCLVFLVACKKKLPQELLELFNGRSPIFSLPNACRLDYCGYSRVRFPGEVRAASAGHVLPALVGRRRGGRERLGSPPGFLLKEQGSQ